MACPLKVVGVFQSNKFICYLHSDFLTQHHLSRGQTATIAIQQKTVPVLLLAFCNWDHFCSQVDLLTLSENECLISSILQKNFPTTDLELRPKSLNVDSFSAASSVTLELLDLPSSQLTHLIPMIPSLLQSTPISPNMILSVDWFNQENLISISNVVFPAGYPHACGYIADSTDITIVDTVKPHHETKLFSSWTESILSVVGGMDELITSVMSLINMAYDPTERALCRGVLFHGPPGTGKTMTAQLISNCVKSKFMAANEIFGSEEVTTSEKLSSSFKWLKTNGKEGPTLLVIDDFEAIGSPDESAIQQRIRGQFIKHMKDISRGPQQPVFVIGIASSLKDIETSLLSVDCFPFQFEFCIPDANQRQLILEKKLSKFKNLPPAFVNKLVSGSHGFSPADVDRLVCQGLINAFKRHNYDKDSTQDWKDLDVTQIDLEKALLVTKPSTLQEYSLGVPAHQRLAWEDLIGVEPIIERLKASILIPLQYHKELATYGLTVPVGVLLHGPPGTGKSSLVYAVASQTTANFIQVEGVNLVSSYVGEAPRALAKVFAKARSCAPAILLIEQLEALAPKPRDGHLSEGDEHILTTLRTELDGLNRSVDHPVIVIATTNKPSMIEPSLLRAGRFSIQLPTALPNKIARKAILAKAIGRMPSDINDNYLEQLAKKTMEWTPSMLLSLCQSAAMEAMRNNQNKVLQQHFDVAFNQILR